ncbi:FtsB family cell division protein [Bacillus sp. B1-b2]|uniref:FtsB family cell division protein n=1 Tax=Bacillus sp. B1-b2 TaxID=2653201 RepID=UPI0012620183|nr:septum formation initiator family protein [Bacillus sp. B1-b2]KAB7664958.1 septum formation initiator family protein [Bacillus sp. B1-b2]
MSAIRKIDVPTIPTELSNQPDNTTLSGARKKKLLLRRLTTFLICVGIISFLMVSTLISQSSILKEKRAEKAVLDEQVVALEKKEVELNDQIAKLNDEEYLAKLARKDLLLSKDGEIIFNIPNDENGKKSENGK